MSEKSPNIDEWAEGLETIPSQAESNLEMFLKKWAGAGLLDEVKEEDFGKDLPRAAYYKTDQETLENEKYNFGFYNPNSKQWKKVKLTVNNDDGVVRDMTDKYKARGVEVLNIPFGVLKKAASSVPSTETNSFQDYVFEKIKDVLQSN